MVAGDCGAAVVVCTGLPPGVLWQAETKTARPINIVRMVFRIESEWVLLNSKFFQFYQ